MTPIYLSISCLMVLIASVDAGGKVGKFCSSDLDCGINEVCKKAENVATPCKLGKCTCARCFDLNATDDCVPVRKMKLGEKCHPLNLNLKYPLNAICSPNEIVTCSFGWMESVEADSCVRNTSATYGAVCRWSSDCSSDMWCNDNAQCSCYYAYDKYDVALEQCVRKEYGDECLTNNECRVYGQNWNGFTFSTGECLGGRCECSVNGKSAVTGYLDEKTGTFRTKTICVIAGARINASIGERCTTDPIYYGDTPTTSVCGPDSFCYQCPEDLDLPGYRNFDGKCRTLISPEPSLPCPLIGEPTHPVAAMTTDDASSLAWWLQESTTPIPAVLPMADAPLMPQVPFDEFVLGNIVNGTWYSSNPLQRCSSKEDCSPNERCIMSTHCGRGICLCAPPNHEDENGRCQVGFSETSNSTLYSSQKLADEPSHSSEFVLEGSTLFPDDTSNNSSLLLIGEYAQNISFALSLHNCSSNADCLPFAGTVCKVDRSSSTSGGNEDNFPSGNCKCIAKMIWSPLLKRCKHVEYGDPCEIDDDCGAASVPGSVLQCVEERCLCGTNHTALSASILRATWGAEVPLSVKRMAQIPATIFCVPKDSFLIKTSWLHENCTVDIAGDVSAATSASSQQVANVSICANGLTCLFCAGDSTTGTCSNLGGKLITAIATNTVFDNLLLSSVMNETLSLNATKNGTNSTANLIIAATLLHARKSSSAVFNKEPLNKAAMTTKPSGAFYYYDLLLPSAVSLFVLFQQIDV